ncbi:alpha/beta fold hydrolase [Nocardia sp. SC052]|uniref:alpha/beta fold hydrolase n=1 Tax=Nocardia sichangensis TaxID=3385975 RepID=UPI0039A0AEF8
MALPVPRYEESVPTAGGRRLTIAEFGTPNGVPVMLFPGAPVVMVAGAAHGRDAEQLGIRLICLSRPGYGHSDPQPDRRLTDWPSDVSAVADHLGLASFAAVGNSAGGPHALACALLGHRLTSIHIVSGPGEPGLATHSASEVSKLRTQLDESASSPSPSTARESSTLVDRLATGDSNGFQAEAGLADVDMEMMQRPELAEIFKAIPAALAKDDVATGYEWWLLSQPWGIEIKNISVPVHFWHGALDRNCPVDDARRLAASIPGALLTVWPDAGHLAIIDHMRDVLEEIAAQAASKR